MLERFGPDSLGGKNPLFPFKASSSSLEKSIINTGIVLNVTEKYTPNDTTNTLVHTQ